MTWHSVRKAFMTSDLLHREALYMDVLHIKMIKRIFLSRIRLPCIFRHSEWCQQSKQRFHQFSWLTICFMDHVLSSPGILRTFNYLASNCCRIIFGKQHLTAIFSGQCLSANAKRLDFMAFIRSWAGLNDLGAKPLTKLPQTFILLTFRLLAIRAACNWLIELAREWTAILFIKRSSVAWVCLGLSTLFLSA